MSQLFTLQFPKYHFDSQREFTITFNNATELPFSHDITNNIVCVDSLLSATEEQTKNQRFQKQHSRWKRMGLAKGVRIIKINGVNITNETNSGNISHVTTTYIENLIKQHTNENNEIDITFREDILDIDKSQSLGLKYYQNKDIDDSSDFDDVKQHKPMKLLGETHAITQFIHPTQIGASSCQDGFEPYQCRLNNPDSCWKPNQKYIKLNNSWIWVDLTTKTMVSKLRIQGSPHNASFVRAIWIDSSDDGTQWTCYNNSYNKNAGEIKLEYNKLNVNEFGETEEGDTFSEIIIWPAIYARFVRIRPSSYCNEIAIRFDLYGSSVYEPERARAVRYGDLSEEDKRSARLKIKNCGSNTRIIQVDCREVIRRALDEAHMSYVGFVETDKNNYLCVFSTADSTATERTIEELTDIGIGRAMGVAGICPMQFRRPVKQKLITKEQEEEENKQFQLKHHISAGFYSSIKSRQIVEGLVDNTRQSAEFTYDYMSMLLVADVIAAMGLGTNSAVIVVASMLVSPIMGPVLALTFGVHLRKFKWAQSLAILGLKNEIWSLLICIIVGFIVAFVFLGISKNDPSAEWPWPTVEMSSRGHSIGLTTGAIVAFASGVGVALSVVGDYVATVIGVAISASLLPPAVNCGMLWAMSLYIYIYPERGNGYTAKELGSMGTISIILTIENIILVFLASLMMFKIKDVTMRQRSKSLDERDRQLNYEAIVKYKDRYDDIKRFKSSNLGLKKKGMSFKYMSSNKDKAKQYLGKKLDDITVDPTQKGRTLKRKLMKNNTIYRKPSRDNSGLMRLQTELDGVTEDEESGGSDDGEHAGGHSKRSLQVSSKVFKVPTDSTGVLEENEFQPLVQTDDNIAVVQMTEDEENNLLL